MRSWSGSREEGELGAGCRHPSFFDDIDHDWMLRFLEHRIADRRILRLIRKWLKAGVIEDGKSGRRRTGHPARGGDLAAAGEHLPALRLRSLGSALAADGTPGAMSSWFAMRTTVCGLRERRAMPQAFLEQLAGTVGQVRTGRCNAEKTRLIEFGRFAAERRARGGRAGRRRSTSWDSRIFAGPTGRRKFQVVRLTAKKRMRATLTAIRASSDRRRHEPVPMFGAVASAGPAWLLQLPRSSDEPPATGGVPRGGLPRLAACLAAPKSAAPAQLVSLQSPHPQVRPAMPGAASLSGGALRVTT